MSAAGEAHILVCRAGFERALCDEVSWNIHPGRRADGQRRGSGASGPARIDAEGAVLCEPKADAGWVVLGAQAPLRKAPFVFERQRLPRARWDPAGSSLISALLAAWEVPLSQRPGPWTLHAFAPNPDAADSLSGAAQGLGHAFLRALAERRPPLASAVVEPEAAARRPRLPGAPPHARPLGDARLNRAFLPAHRPSESPPRNPPPPDAPARTRVLQLCRVAGGVWSSLASFAELSDPWPGGVHRMPEDPAAPSRSYLKLEEALDVMGIQPRPGERTVDLGAAPGGWSWAFVKRGCSVIAVDRGPLKLPSLGDWGGEVTHLREDGLRFRPERPVDWLASDMLIAPAQALGLLRKWQGGGWARLFVVNFKLPQREPWAALAPLCAALDALPGFRYRLRQLYHDRREVTLMGESLAPSAAAGLPRGPASPARSPARRSQAPPPARAIPARRAGAPAKYRGVTPPLRGPQGKAAPGGRTNHPRRRGRRGRGRRG